MAKKDLNIRQMIREKRLSETRKGELMALAILDSTVDNTEAILSSSDERAIRETADARVLNKYIGGANQVIHCMTVMAQQAEGASSSKNYIDAKLAELRTAYKTIYTPPTVIALTEDAYKREGLKKRERRLKRTYNLAGIVAIAIEDLLHDDKPTSKKLLETALEEIHALPTDDRDDKADLLKDSFTPSEREETTIMQLRLIFMESKSLSDYILDTLSKDYSLILDAMGLKTKDTLRTAIEDDPYSPTFKGELLANIKGVKHLETLLDTPESSNNILDEYDDDDEYDMKSDGYSLRRLYETYDQTYAIIANPSKFTDGQLDNGVLHTQDDAKGELFTPTTGVVANFIVYRASAPEGSISNSSPDDLTQQRPLSFIAGSISNLESRLKPLLILRKWADKAVNLLGVKGSSSYGIMAKSYDPIELYDNYEQARFTFFTLTYQAYILPEYQAYDKAVKKVLRPLWDYEGAELGNSVPSKLLNLTGGDILETIKSGDDKLFNLADNSSLAYTLLPKERKAKYLEAHYLKDKEYREAMELIEAMTLDTIETTYRAIRELKNLSEYKAD